MSESLIRKPTDEQNAVINADEKAFTVVAAAGAGKTFVLVERYLRHVAEEGLGPDQILTITFTKKAAAEMKERIVTSLRNKGMFSEAQVAETGPIQTIHSFCERLLRENALEAGLDPQYEIMSESQASRLTSECIREALASDLIDEPDAENLIHFLAGKSQAYGENRSPYSILETAIERVLQELRSSQFSWEDLTQIYSNSTLLKLKWEDGIRRSLPEKAWSAFDASNADDMNVRVQQACKLTGVPVPSWAKGKADIIAERDAMRHTCGLVQLACAAWWRLDREMSSRQCLDFTALEVRADRLLRRSHVTRERLGTQYKVVMVDESQDVNPIQYRLLDNLGTERIMMVGDAQQSIYGFRQADVRLFRERSCLKGTKQLSKNWRSVDGILNFVDIVFSRLWGPDYRPMNVSAGPMDFDSGDRPTYEGVEIWRQPSKDTRATATFIQELLDEGEKANDIAVLVRDGAGALAMQQALVDAGIPNRIAGGSERFYTRLEVRDLSNTLRALADPYDDFSLLATLRSPMVGLTLDSITMLGLNAPVIEQLESFEPPLVEDLPRLREFMAWFMPLRHHADRLSAWEVLSEIYSKSEYLPALARRAKGDQMLANARKLLTLAAQEPELGPLEYAERIREIQDLRHKEGDAPADDEDADLVKIMTIHKAKGLEWPVVVLPQTDKKLSGQARDVVIDPIDGLVAAKFGKGQSTMHKLLTEKKKRKEDEEENRVLYVGLTRAKKRLCICYFPPGNATTVSKLLEGVVDPQQLQGLRVRESKR